MNDHDYTALMGALNSAVEILDRNRTPDPGLIAAYDTLKQARAMAVKALDTTGARQRGTIELVAA